MLIKKVAGEQLQAIYVSVDNLIMLGPRRSLGLTLQRGYGGHSRIGQVFKLFHRATETADPQQGAIVTDGDWALTDYHKFVVRGFHN